MPVTNPRKLCPHLRSMVRHLLLPGRLERVPVHGCERHGECTIHPVTGYRNCRDCADRPAGTWLYPAHATVLPDELFQGDAVRRCLRQALAVAPAPRFERPSRLNLLYHITPFADNEIWRWNVATINRYAAAFNGQRTVAIATGEKMAPAAEVREAINFDCEFLEFENSAALREAVSFADLLRSAKSTDPAEATFYAHARGVSRPTLTATHCWTTCMYRHLLDDVPPVQDLLARHTAAGVTFRFSDTGWLYPGTFFWFRNDAVFTREGWDRLENTQAPDAGLGWAVEAFPNRFLMDGARLMPLIWYRSLRSQQLYSGEFWSDQKGIAEERYPVLESGSLAEVYERYSDRTDKGTLHSYIPFYEQLLVPWRDLPITLAEIGVLNGGSLKLWADHLPRARIVGIDVSPRPADLPAGIEFLRGDAAVIERFPVDVVIDDGSHLLAEQIAAFRHWWPSLRHGGAYVIEDVQSDNDLTALLALHPFRVEDLRGERGRYDDRIAWAVKA